MARLTTEERKRLRSSSFVFPEERRYPIEDPAHARNALARVSQFGTPAEKRAVRSAVHKKYPQINCQSCGMPKEHGKCTNAICPEKVFA